MLFNIQVLRAVAALLVVHAHAAGPAGLDLGWDGGANGVDLFFVISGFIISYVASLTTEQFLTRRLIRIVPIYWSSTLALWVLVVVAPQLFRTTSADPELLVRSLLFVPTAWNVHTSDGLPHPTLAGGWTLNYEMYFYVVFALSLAISRRRATLISTVLLATVVAVVELGDLRSSAIAHFYGYPIIFEFVLGMLAFHVVRRLENVSPRLLPVPLLVIALLAGFILLAFTEAIFGDAPRWIVSGLPSFIIVIAAVLLERTHDFKITNRYVVLVGDASYVMYLIQAYVLYGIIRIGFGRRSYGELEGQVIVVGLMAMCILVAAVVYRYYEQPILRVLKRRLLRSRPTLSEPAPRA